MSKETFTHQDMAETQFHDVCLKEADFNNVNLGGAKFENVNLSGATFTDINFSHVTITESCIEGLNIWGFDIQALIEAEKERQQGKG